MLERTEAQLATGPNAQHKLGSSHAQSMQAWLQLRWAETGLGYGPGRKRVGARSELRAALGSRKIFRGWNQARRAVCRQHFRLVSQANKYDQRQSQSDGEQVEDNRRVREPDFSCQCMTVLSALTGENFRAECD